MKIKLCNSCNCPMKLVNVNTAGNYDLYIFQCEKCFGLNKCLWDNLKEVD